MTTKVEQATTSHGYRPRIPFFITTRDMLNYPYRPMVPFYVNPAEAQWKIATRTSVKLTHGGQVHFSPKVAPTEKFDMGKFDIPVVTFQFQTGNIWLENPEASIDQYQTGPNSLRTLQETSIKDFTGAQENPFYKSDAEQSKQRRDDIAYYVDNPVWYPIGLGNFYDFLAFLNMPNTSTFNTPNEVIIGYRTHMFPLLTLYGFFDPGGVSFTESADRPGTIQNWTASFQVFYTNPQLSFADLKRQYSEIKSDKKGQARVRNLFGKTG